MKKILVLFFAATCAFGFSLDSPFFFNKFNLAIFESNGELIAIRKLQEEKYGIVTISQSQADKYELKDPFVAKIEKDGSFRNRNGGFFIFSDAALHEVSDYTPNQIKFDGYTVTRKWNFLDEPIHIAQNNATLKYIEIDKSKLAFQIQDEFVFRDWE